MTDQLVLIDIAANKKADTGNSWQLDPATCDIGQRGVARARQALHAARKQARTGTVPRPDLPAAA